MEAAGQDPPWRSIDHIAIPAQWTSGEADVERSQSDGRFLSDHPSYVVAVEAKWTQFSDIPPQSLTASSV